MNTIGKFCFSEAPPEEARETVEVHLQEAAWLIPEWVQRVWVRWHGQGDPNGAQMTVQVSYEYRYATVWFYPTWLSESAENKRRLIIHEFLHMSINPLADYAETITDRLLADEPKFAETVKEQISERTESAITDLADLINRKLG